MECKQIWADVKNHFNVASADFPKFYLYHQNTPGTMRKVEVSKEEIDSGHVTNVGLLWEQELSIADMEDFANAIVRDHLAVCVQNGYKLDKYFQTSNVIIADADNGAKDVQYDMQELVDTIKKLGVKCIVYPSKSCGTVAHNNTEPKICCHLAFPLSEPIDDYNEYKALKGALRGVMPWLDDGAKAVTQKTFCTPASTLTAYNPFYIDGGMYIDQAVEPSPQVQEGTDDIFRTLGGGAAVDADVDHLPNYKAQAIDDVKQNAAKVATDAITDHRNDTLHRYACTVLFRYDGDVDKCKELFLTKAKTCEPPLAQAELDKIWQSAVKSTKEYLDQHKDDDDRLPADVYSQGLEPEDFTDVDQARVLLTKYGKFMLYCNELGWLIWTNKRWEPSEEKAIRLEHILTKEQLKDAKDKCKKAWAEYATVAQAEGAKSDKAVELKRIADHYENYKKHVLTNRLQRKIANVLECAKVYRMVKIEQLDADGYLLNTPGGTIDLRTGDVYKPRRKDYITKITSVGVPPTVQEEKQSKLIDFITQVCVTKELADYMQIVVGMALCGKVLAETLVIAYGGGRNGKSTFWNLFKYILGDYAGSVRSDLLTITKTNNNSDSQKASLRGKRLVIAAELDEEQRLNTSMLKQLCSTDDINACLKFREPFDFKPSHTVVLYTNHLPSVGTMDDGTWRRIKDTLIPFNARFEGANENKDMAQYLEKELASTALQWAIDGAVKFLAAGGHLSAPRAVVDASSSYRASNDTLELFIQDCCRRGAGLQAKAGELQKAWKQYCADNSYYPGKGNSLKQRMIDYGFPWKKTNIGAVYEGLTLNDDIKDQNTVAKTRYASQY